ncbi:MAG: hypothetical protein V2B20_18500 [Pseudomonadota bacterium]
MAIDAITHEALNSGRNQATRVLALRAVSLKKREKALKSHARKVGKKGPPVGAVKGVAALDLSLPSFFGNTETAGILVAEGDSWFDYPMHDILKLLEDNHGYDVESMAHKGDTIEGMAYGENQLSDFIRSIEKVLRRGDRPKAILLSGGGNDIAGAEFGMMVNHRGSAIAGLNDKVVSGVIDERIRTAYITILSSVTQVCKELTGAVVPILVHGYDYPVPDGRGFMGGWGPLPGPWLEPGYREKGFEDLEQRVTLTMALIDRFNSMLGGIVGLPDFAHVQYIDLRNTLLHGAGYKKFWANELHPNEGGFTKVTEKFAEVLGKL